MTITTSKPQASVAELFIVLGIAFGQFIVSSLQSFVYRAAQLPGAEHLIVFTDEVLISIVSFEIAMGLICYVILAVRGWTLEDFNLRPSWKLTAIGFLLVGLDYLLFNVAFWLVGLLIGTQILESV